MAWYDAPPPGNPIGERPGHLCVHAEVITPTIAAARHFYDVRSSAFPNDDMALSISYLTTAFAARWMQGSRRLSGRKRHFMPSELS